MELDKSIEPTQGWYWIEMGRVGRKLAEEFFPIHPGEQVVITADTRSDQRVIEEAVKAVYAAGAMPTLIVHPATAVHTSGPPPAVAAALKAAEVWLEFNDSYLIYSDAWKRALEAGVRHFIFPGDADSFADGGPGGLCNPGCTGQQAGRAPGECVRSAHHERPGD